MPTVRGVVSSRWERREGQIVWEIVIPAGCTGTVYLPGKESSVTVESGTHTYSW